MRPLTPIQSYDSPREIIAEDFNIDLPIRGGWGYAQDDACIIDKHDPTVDPTLPFNGVAVERVFVEKRIYEEMIVFRPNGERFSGIRWNLLKQKLLQDGDNVFDKLVFEVTAFTESDWEELKAEWEGPDGFGSPHFDVVAHNKKRNARMIRLTKEFWFEISSFYFGTRGDGGH